jgi:ABC-2 type transport system ATP-binding protein
MTTLSIRTDRLTLKFPEVYAVDDLNLDIRGEKIVGLLGRNGSGKSSLLSVIAAFRKPTAGQVPVNGEPIWENPLITRQVCLIREEGDTVEGSEKVDDALKFAAEMRPNWDDGYARSLLERFDIAKRAKVSQLSKGQRSALGITLGLAARAPITIFDESYLGLDAPSRYRFYDEVVADYARHPRLIILSTHLIGEVSTLFEEVVIIDRGKLLLHESADELLGRGIEIIGPADAVDGFVRPYKVLNQRSLGRTKSATIYGSLTDEDRHRAVTAGVELGPVSIQDLFVHLTEPGETAQ